MESPCTRLPCLLLARIPSHVDACALGAESRFTSRARSRPYRFSASTLHDRARPRICALERCLLEHRRQMPSKLTVVTMLPADAAASGRSPGASRPSRRSGIGAFTESTPSRLTPRRMNGITVVLNVWLAASPMLASVPPTCMVLAIHDSTSPPRLSTAPAQVALSSGLILARSRRAAQHHFLRRPSPLR